MQEGSGDGSSVGQAVVQGGKRKHQLPCSTPEAEAWDDVTCKTTRHNEFEAAAAALY